MKILKISLLLLTFFFFLLTACKKEKLTKETQIGANTFSCKINGKVYVAKSELFSKGLIGSITNYNGKQRFSVGSVMYHGDESGYAVWLSISDFVSTGIYDLNEETGRVEKTKTPTADYTSRPNGRGTLNVKYWDRNNRIIAGTFEFVAVNINNPNETITITEGRFDLKY